MKEVGGEFESISHIDEDGIFKGLQSFINTVSTHRMFYIDNPHLEMRRNYGYITISLSSQTMMEDVIQILMELLRNANVLYSYRSKDNGKRQKAVVYSTPFQDSMYIIGIESAQYGIVESINLTFYNSMEIMFEQLLRMYEQFQKTKADVIDFQPINELYKNFM